MIVIWIFYTHPPKKQGVNFFKLTVNNIVLLQILIITILSEITVELHFDIISISRKMWMDQ